MKKRHAASIRKGILAARDPELSQYVHLAPRLVREAARREADNMHWRELWHWLTNAQSNHTRPEHAAVIRQVDDMIRTRIAAQIQAEQAEHLRRFYA